MCLAWPTGRGWLTTLGLPCAATGGGGGGCMSGARLVCLTRWVGADPLGTTCVRGSGSVSGACLMGLARRVGAYLRHGSQQCFQSRDSPGGVPGTQAGGRRVVRDLSWVAQ